MISNPNPFFGEQDADSQKSQKSLYPNVQYSYSGYISCRAIKIRNYFYVSFLLCRAVDSKYVHGKEDGQNKVGCLVFTWPPYFVQWYCRHLIKELLIKVWFLRFGVKVIGFGFCGSF